MTWYKSLIGKYNSLIKNEGYMPRGIIIRKHEDNNISFAELYPSDIYKLLQTKNIKEGHTILHEIPLYYMSIKPRFDIEGLFDTENKQIIDDIIQQFHIALKNIIDTDIKYSVNSYNSSGFYNDKWKLSIHIIVNGVHHEDYMQSKIFCEKVINYIDNTSSNNYKQYIDAQIYTKNHSLRILGCSKDGRLKRLMDESEYSFDDLKLSLVSFCRFSTTLYERQLKLFDSTDIDISVQVKEYIQEFLDESYNGIFKIQNAVSVGDNIIINLRRQRKGLCHVCDKIHDSENAYISVFNNDFKFVCRRNKELQTSIGKVNININKEEKQYPSIAFMSTISNEIVTKDDNNKNKEAPQAYYNDPAYD